MPRELIFTMHTCACCGKKFEAPGTPVPGMYCKECTNIARAIGEVRFLLHEDFVRTEKDKEMVQALKTMLDKGLKFSRNEYIVIQRMLVALLEQGVIVKNKKLQEALAKLYKLIVDRIMFLR